VPGLRLFEVRVSVALRRLLLGLAAILVGACQAAGQAGCPTAIATELAAEAPVCELLSEGRLDSALGNGAVDCRLYRWTPLDWPEPPLHDSPPYNINAVTLSLAAPGAAPFWTAHYWPDSAWIDQPYLAQHPEYGEFLVVLGRFFGTGRFTEDFVFLPDRAGGWAQVQGTSFDGEGGANWWAGLARYLPLGHGVWKGVVVDYATLTGNTAVWRDADANCCPSGGGLWFRLRLTGPEQRLEVAEARYTPPE